MRISPRQPLSGIPPGTLVTLVLLLGITTGQAQRDPIAREIARVGANVAVVPEANRQAVADRLERAKAALAAGHSYLALYELHAPFELEAGFAFAAAEKQVATNEDFRKRWEALGAPKAPPASKAPVLFVEALAQSAEGRAPATYRASLPYAQDSGLYAGLYYLGESHAMERFASFSRTLGLSTSRASLPLKSIAPVLAAFEREVVGVFDAVTDENRPRFIGVNVAIKLARTLDEQKRYEGALLQYLVSRYRFALIRARDVAAPLADDVAARIRATQLPVDADHSVAEFLLQLATATNAGVDPGPRGAAVILDDVLPAYFAAIKSRPVDTTFAQQAPVTITFIRWPFT